MTAFKTQWPIFVVLAVLTPLGLATKFYHGPMQAWVHAYAGDIFYPMFWYFLAALFFPTARPVSLCLFVFFFSAGVELTQLFDAPAFVWFRQSFLGRTLAGTSFSVADILYYYIGSQIALFLHLGLHFFFFPLASTEPEREYETL